MSTLIIKTKLPNGQNWGVMADGGMGLDNIDAFVLVPVLEIEAMTPEQIGNTVLSLALDAKAARVKCAMEDCFPPFHDVSLRHVDELLFEAEKMFGKTDVLEGTSNQEFHNDWGWVPDWSFSKLRELRDKITASLRAEYASLLQMRATRQKNRLPPGKQKRLETVVEMLHGCKLCFSLDGNHTESCKAATLKLQVSESR
jgi:hypothetical protein